MLEKSGWQFGTQRMGVGKTPSGGQEVAFIIVGRCYRSRQCASKRAGTSDEAARQRASSQNGTTPPVPGERAVNQAVGLVSSHAERAFLNDTGKNKGTVGGHGCASRAGLFWARCQRTKYSSSVKASSKDMSANRLRNSS